MKHKVTGCQCHKREPGEHKVAGRVGIGAVVYQACANYELEPVVAEDMADDILASVKTLDLLDQPEAIYQQVRHAAVVYRSIRRFIGPDESNTVDS